MGTEKSCFHEVSFVDEDGRTSRTKISSIVQELARQGIQQLPARFIRIPQEPPGLSPSLLGGNPLETLPTIDIVKLKSYQDPETRSMELHRLVSGFKEWGLVFVKLGPLLNHALVDSLEAVVKGFFALSFEEKMDSVGSYQSMDNRGYGKSFVKSGHQSQTWIDRLAMRVFPNQDSLGLRIWPQNPVNFRPAMEKYAEAARELCDELLEALAEALKLERQILSRQFNPRSESMVNVRVNYYPPCPIFPDPVMGIPPHTDAGALTVLAQFDGTEGLEVLKQERWVRVPAPSDALLVQAGDVLEIMSNGRIESPCHRAIARSKQERLSVALFYFPPLRGEINPVVKGSGTEEPAVYRKVVTEEYLNHFYKVNPCKEKVAINFARVAS